MDDSIVEDLLQQLIDQNSHMIDRLNELIVRVQEIAREMDGSDPHSFESAKFGTLMFGDLPVRIQCRLKGDQLQTGQSCHPIEGRYTPLTLTAVMQELRHRNHNKWRHEHPYAFRLRRPEPSKSEAKQGDEITHQVD